MDSNVGIRFRVLNRDPLYDYREACKLTQGVELEQGTSLEVQNILFAPKDEITYWIKQIVANHSTLRSVRFRLVAKAPKSVIMQLIRATKGHPQPEVESSRPDWTGQERSSNPYEEKLFSQDHTAESFVEMAKQRLCKRTEVNTRKFMELLVEVLRASKDPFLKAVGYCSAPACYWYKRCPEIKGCSDNIVKLSDVIIEKYKNDKE